MFNHEMILEHKAAITKRMAYHYPDFVEGAYVGVRYKLDPSQRYGRIQKLKIAYPDNFHFTKSGEYGMFVIRMENGELREEHPEHLCPAHAPTPELVEDSGLFGMMVETMEAYRA